MVQRVSPRQVAQALMPVRFSRLSLHRCRSGSLQTRTGKSACATWRAFATRIFQLPSFTILRRCKAKLVEGGRHSSETSSPAFHALGVEKLNWFSGISMLLVDRRGRII